MKTPKKPQKPKIPIFSVANFGRRPTKNIGKRRAAFLAERGGFKSQVQPVTLKVMDGLHLPPILYGSEIFQLCV